MVMNADGSYDAVKRADGVLLLSDIKLTSEPIYKTGLPVFGILVTVC